MAAIIFMAQMYKESGDQQEAMRISDELYKQIEKLRPSYVSCLAMGYVSLGSCDKARASLLYLKGAAELSNYPAAKQYVSLMLDKDPHFDSTQYLVKFYQ